jgi:hypothetical protein
MPIFTRPIHESNDCHTPAGSEAGGQFCAKPGAPSPPGKGKRPRPGRVSKGTGYTIMFRSQQDPHLTIPGTWFTRGLRSQLGQHLEPEDARKIRSAKVLLRFEGWATAQLGAPIRWQAPNGVWVVYLRGQRRDERTGSGTYHDFRADSQEAVVPLTRNVGPGRRALRAWAKEFMEDKQVARFKARQLVRPGD